MGTLFVDNIKQQSSQGSGTITIGASGETVALASGVKQSNLNYPMFQVHLESTQSISNNVTTIVQFDEVDFDTASCWDSTNYRFTPNVAGKYLFYKNISMDNSSGVFYMSSEIRKNGSAVTTGRPMNVNANQSTSDNTLETINQFASGIIDMNGTSDYVEAVGYLYNTGSNNQITGSNRSMFGGYRIGT